MLILRALLLVALALPSFAGISKIETCTGSPNCAGLGLATITGPLSGQYWLVPVSTGWTPVAKEWTAEPTLVAQTIVVDAGGPTDTGFSGPTSTYTVPPALMPVTVLPPGTNDATMRFGNPMFYHITVPAPGLYTVSLYFQEPTYQIAQQRIMAVTANDTPIIQGLDLFAEAGYLVPTQKQGIVSVAGTDLNLTFTAQNFTVNGTRNAVVSMIVVQPTLTFLCDMRQLPPKNVFVSWLDPVQGPVFLAGLTPNEDYVCGSYSLATAQSYAVSMASCQAYQPPKPCLTADIAAAGWGVLNQRCTRCHGGDSGWTDSAGVVHYLSPDSALSFAATNGADVDGLDLRTKTAMLMGGNRGPALVPGDPTTSLIWLYTALSDTDAPYHEPGPGMISWPNTPSATYVANLNALDAYLQAIGVPEIPSLSGNGTEGPVLAMPQFAPLQPAEIEALENWILIGAPDAGQ